MNKFNITKSKALMCSIVFIIAFAAVFAVFSVKNASYSAYAAQDARQGTMLSGGKGLQFGNNKLELSASGDGNASGSGSGGQTVDFYDSRDFFVLGTQSYSYSPNTIQVKGGSINSKIKFETDSASQNAGVYNAIKDSNMKVDFRFNVIIKNKSNTAIVVTTNLGYSNNKTDGSQWTPDQETKTKTIEVGGKINITDLALNDINVVNDNNKANNYFSINIAANNPDAEYEISAASINMSVILNGNIGIANNSQYTVSGVNRHEQTFDTTSRNTDYVDMTKELYIKTGDIITFRVTTNIENQFYEFPSYYKDVFGLSGNTGVFWQTSATGSNGATGLDSRLMPVAGSDRLIVEGDKKYYQIAFEVGVSSNLLSISVLPTVYTQRDAAGYGIPKESTEIILKVDDKTPEQPVIDTTSPLGNKILKREYYTSAADLMMGRDYSLFDDGVESVSLEYLYAFVMDKDIKLIDFSDTTKNYFAPNISVSYKGYQRQALVTYETYQITKTDASGVAIKESTNAVINKKHTSPLKFPTIQDQEFTLVLVAVDAAGNISNLKIYSRITNNSALVDNNLYGLDMAFRKGADLVSTGDMSSVAKIHIIQGVGTHDINGNLMLNGNPATAAEIIKLGGYTYNPKQGNKIKVKRDEWATVVVEMTKANSKAYQLVSYDNGGKISGNEITFTPNDGNTGVVFALKPFQVNSENGMVSDVFKRTITFVFKEILNLTINYISNEANADYNGAIISINDNIKAQRKDASATEITSGIKYAIQYYRFINYTAVLNANGVGGVVTINGVTYTIDSGNLLAIGNIVTIDAHHHYKTIAEPISHTTNAQGKKVYTVVSYCMDEPNKGGDGILRGFIDAGKYWYTVAIETNVRYFGLLEGPLNIKQIIPNIKNVTVNSIVFGESITVGKEEKKGLDMLEFESEGQDGKRILASTLVNLFNKNYNQSFYGVLGMYVITSPTPGSRDYTNPNVNGNFVITVEFRPIDITKGANGNDITNAEIEANYAHLQNYYNSITSADGTHYQLKEGGLHSGNYKMQPLEISVVITHKEVTDIKINNKTRYIYDGAEKAVELVSSVANLPYIIEYKKKGADDTTYSAQKPFNAGEYVVRYSIDSTKSNYYSKQQEAPFIIEKRKLDVTLKESAALAEPVTYDNLVFDKQVIFAYGMMAAPKVLATFVLNTIPTQIPVGYYYQHKKVLQYNGLPTTTIEDYGDPYNTIIPKALDAGTYIFKMTVDNINNQGEIYVLLKLYPAIESGGDVNLKVTPPSLKSEYYVYNLDNSMLTAGIDQTVGHIEYGQTIRSLQKTIFNITPNTIATYTYRGESSPTIIPGRFYLEEESAINTRLSLSPVRNDKGELILPVIYNQDGNTIRPYEIYLYWQAGEYKNDIFIPNNNFAIKAELVPLYVARATLDFSSVKLSDLIYGASISAATFVGNPTTNGMAFTMENVDGASLAGLVFNGVTIGADEFSNKKVLIMRDSNNQIVSYLAYEKPATSIYEKGDYDVQCKFATRSDFAKSYRSINSVIIPIKILPQAATIAFELTPENVVEHKYGTKYAAPKVTTTPAGINVKFAYFNAIGEQVVISDTTPVGAYTVTATINDKNYGGSSSATYNVIKSDLKIYLAPEAPQTSYGVNLGEITLTAGRCISLGNVTIDGKFEFVEKTIVPKVGSFPYRVRFIPNDKNAYNSYNEFFYDYILNINKKQVVIKCDNLVHTFDSSPKRPVASAVDPQGNPLEIVIKYTNWTPQAGAPLDPVMAGKYTVNISVRSENYDGSINVTLNIGKKSVVINNGDQTFAYDGNDKFITPSADVDNLSYIVTYKNNSNYATEHPNSVGKYTAKVVVDHVNYQGTEYVTMYITEAEFVMYNLEQTFNMVGNAAVTATFTPSGIIHTVLYRVVGSTANFSPDIPVNAGSYEISIAIEHEGYVKNVTHYPNGNLIILTIAKDKAAIMAAESYTRPYTSFANNDITYTINPLVATRIWYKMATQTDEHFTLNAPTNSGTYVIKIEAVDKNYFGVAYSTLIITPATPIITDNPRITSANKFSHSLTEVTFDTTGIVLFSATGENIASQGKWVIDENDESFRKISVGQHNVKLKFVPNDTVNFVATNLTSVGGITATININIIKEDIGKFIVLNPNDLVQTFTNSPLSVRASLAPEANIAPNYGDISIRVTYNGNTIAPSNVAEYEVSATIEDANYAGLAKPVILKIEKANISIIAPKYADVMLGSKVSDIKGAIAGGEGKAFIATAGSSEISTTIKGVFVFDDPSIVFTKANYQTVKMSFYPENTQNYNNREFYVEIFVLAKDVVVEGVTATQITYGDTLSKSILSATSTTVDGVPIEGKFSWAQPNEIVNVGDSAKYVFTPANIDNYNIKTGIITVPIIKARLWVDTSTLLAKVYVGAGVTIRKDAKISVNVYHDGHKGDINWLVKNAQISFVGNENTALDAPVLVPGVTNGIKLGIADSNYEPLELSNVAVHAYYFVNSEQFQVKNTEKIYDGRNATIPDFGVSLTGTEYQIANSDLSMTIKYKGVVVNRILEAGEYEVTISLITQIVEPNGSITYTDIKYDGSATFKYYVKKLDISDSITIINNEKIYGDYSKEIGAIFTGYDVDPTHIVFNYFSTDRKTAYGIVAPQNAGDYLVEVTISSLDNKFTAQKAFSYKIGKLNASIILKNNYSFVFGNPVSIVPDISNNITSANYTVTYDGSPILPINVGDYAVVFTINHDNFIGTARTVLIIKPATLALEEMPTLSTIKYGQPLSNSKITGGKVVFGTAAIPQNGKFSFVEPTKNNFVIGANTIKVQFVPGDSNYATLIFNAVITVTKALGGIELLNSTAMYTGLALAPQFATTPTAGLNVIIIYRQKNNIVLPINAGDYDVEIRLNDETYEGVITITFTIKKAVAVSVKQPTSSPVVYGNALATSTLTNGMVVYSEGGSAISGDFYYDNGGTDLGEVGVYNNVAYTFVPTDTKNYENYHGIVTVTVIKAVAPISVTGVNFVYGNRIVAPVFSTEPKNMLVRNAEFTASNIEGTIQEVGTYQFKAHIDNKNYEGEITYTISVTKKKLTVYYIDSENLKMERYTTVYLQPLYVKAKIDPNSLVPQDIANLEKIEEYLTYNYSYRDGALLPDLHIPPVPVGEYKATVEMSYKNYYVESSECEILYFINLARVEYLEFDSNSLSTQIYGAVSAPYVVTRPANVKYKISFPGYDVMPTMAGAYSIKVLVVDENYEPTEKTSIFRINPKEVTIENIKVTNKAFDGYATIGIKGDLKGIMVGDEVNLTMTARTKDSATAVGTYFVEILTWELTGLHAKYYIVIPPLFNGRVKITSKAISDPNTGSYITSANGFSQNVTVSFVNVDDKQNKSNFFSSLFGQDAITQKISIKENGLETVLSEKVKFFVKIPDKYLKCANVTVEAMGALAEETIVFTREGDYMTFYANKSGEIAIFSTDIPYSRIIVVGVIIIAIIGVILLFIFLPIKRRIKIKNRVRRIHEKELEYKIKAEERAENLGRKR